MEIARKIHSYTISLLLKPLATSPVLYVSDVSQLCINSITASEEQ